MLFWPPFASNMIVFRIFAKRILSCQKMASLSTAGFKQQQELSVWGGGLKKRHKQDLKEQITPLLKVRRYPGQIW